MTSLEALEIVLAVSEMELLEEDDKAERLRLRMAIDIVESFKMYAREQDEIDDGVNCANCGRQVGTDEAIRDTGEGLEAGHEFAYCSEVCKESH